MIYDRSYLQKNKQKRALLRGPHQSSRAERFFFIPPFNLIDTQASILLPLLQ